MASFAKGDFTKSQMQISRTQFYGVNGTGRDSYINVNNGGFCPAKGPCQIEELGSFYY